MDTHEDIKNHAKLQAEILDKRYNNKVDTNNNCKEVSNNDGSTVVIKSSNNVVLEVIKNKVK